MYGAWCRFLALDYLDSFCVLSFSMAGCLFEHSGLCTLCFLFFLNDSGVVPEMARLKGFKLFDEAGFPMKIFSKTMPNGKGGHQRLLSYNQEFDHSKTTACKFSVSVARDC